MCLSGYCFTFAQGQLNTEQIVKNHVRSKVFWLCEYISDIVDGNKDTRENRLHFSNKALSLFINKGNSYEENGVTRKGVIMAVTSLIRKNQDGTPYVFRPLMRNYLIRLANLDKRYGKVVIQHIDIANVKVSDLRPHPTDENMLIGTCCIDMGFEGYNGELLHNENETKKIKFYVTKEEVDGTRDYLVFFGDVESLETRKLTY
jgi:hypothetical protein